MSLARTRFTFGPFRSGEGKTQISTGGGRLPVWNPNGGELFYLNHDRMMAVDVEMDGELTLGEPRMLFEKSSGIRAYDVAPDGERFVLIVPGETEQARPGLILVQNGTEELKRLVPTEH